MSDIPDYSMDQPPKDQDAITRLGTLVAQLAILQLEEEELEMKLKLKTLERRKYEEDLVPALMQEMDITNITTRGGLQVEIKDIVRASLPKDPSKRQRAFKWLRETGNDGIIKREFKIQYGRGDDTWAEQFSMMLDESGVADHAAVSQTESIHASTLKAFVKEQLMAGTDIPLDAFGAFEQKFAKIKRG